MILHKVSHSPFDRPIKNLQPSLEALPINAESERNVFNTSGVAVKRVENHIAPIEGLLKPSGPFAIRGAIGSIVVNALKRVTKGPFAHIGFKYSEVLPFRTNRYSPAPIASPRSVSRVIAPIAHGSPHPVNRAFGLFGHNSPRWASASTTKAGSAHELPRFRPTLFAAVTSAKYQTCRSALFNVAKNLKFSVTRIKAKAFSHGSFYAAQLNPSMIALEP